VGFRAIPQVPTREAQRREFDLAVKEDLEILMGQRGDGAASTGGSSGAGATTTLPASSISNVPAGNIAATDVQAALNELDTEKLATNGSAAGLTSFPTLNQNTTGSAAKLTTARTINGVSFDGTANITVTDASVGLNVGGSTVDPNTADQHVILTNHANSPSASAYWHITTTFYSTKTSTSNRGQVAVQYNGGNQVWARSFYSPSWTAWVRCDQGNASSSATASTLMLRDGNGYAFAQYFNAPGSFSTSGAASGMSLFVGTNGSDNYARSYTPAAAALALAGTSISHSAITVNNGASTPIIYMGSGGSASSSQMQMYSSNVIRGYFYADSSGNGLLSNGGGWTFRNNYGTNNFYMPGSIGIGGISTPTSFMIGGLGPYSAKVAIQNAVGATDYALITTDGTNTHFAVRDDGMVVSGAGAGSRNNNTTAAAANVVIGAYTIQQRSTSSRRYKTDITDSARGLADVLKLRPVTYRGINDGDKVFGGLIAEELDDIGLSEFVQYNEAGQPDSIYYGPLTSLLAKAVQEQQAQIAALTARIEALEAK